MNKSTKVKIKSLRRTATLVLAALLFMQSILAEASKHYLKDYNFSTDWFTYNIHNWRRILFPFKEKPRINYLEIGVFEGRSLIWMLENILTHSTAKATCIDVFEGEFKKTFFTNLKLSGFADKVTTITGRSQIELRRLPLNSFDIIYIDGSHVASDVLTDAVFSWSLLKGGGLLIFDDYLWVSDCPVDLKPQVAIDTFITAYRNQLEVIHHGYQVILEKRRNPCSRCVPIGQYVYFYDACWPNQESQLYHSDTHEAIELSNIEKELLERLIKSRKFGEANFSTDSEIFRDERFINLRKRLELDF